MIDVEAFSCQELVELVTEYLEGALSPADLRRFEEHIAGCDGCTRYLEEFKLTIELVGALTPDDVSTEAESELLDVFRSWRAQSGGNQPES